MLKDENSVLPLDFPCRLFFVTFERVDGDLRALAVFNMDRPATVPQGLLGLAPRVEGSQRTSSHVSQARSYSANSNTSTASWIKVRWTGSQRSLEAAPAHRLSRPENSTRPTPFLCTRSNEDLTSPSKLFPRRSSSIKALNACDTL